MANNKPGWAVELVGEKIDIDDLRELLVHPFDPWIEDYFSGDWDPKPLIRSASWAAFKKSEDVFREASRVVERLNGEALLIYTDARPLKLGTVMIFDENGKRKHVLFAATGHFHVTLGRLRGRIRGVTNDHPKPPEESRVQKWFRQAESDDTLAELFAHLSRADNWFDLYKSIELAENLVASTARKAALGPSFAEWKRVRQTANCYRHAPDPVKFPIPTPPVEFDDAREFILRTIPKLVESALRRH